MGVRWALTGAAAVGTPQLSAVVRKQATLESRLGNIDVAGHAELVAFGHQLGFAQKKRAPERGDSPARRTTARQHSANRVTRRTAGTGAQGGCQLQLQCHPQPVQQVRPTLAQGPWAQDRSRKKECVCVCDSIITGQNLQR